MTKKQKLYPERKRFFHYFTNIIISETNIDFKVWSVLKSLEDMDWLNKKGLDFKKKLIKKTNKK